MVSRIFDPRPPRGDSRGRSDGGTTIVCIETSRRPGAPFRHRFTLEGEKSPVCMVTAVLIDAKLGLVDEHRKAQPES